MMNIFSKILYGSRLKNYYKIKSRLTRYFILLLSLTSLLFSSQCVLASHIKQVAHILQTPKHTQSHPQVTLRSSIRQHTQISHKTLRAGNDNKITSNAFNFASMYAGSVDGRTGTYSFNATLGKVYGNAGFGPNYNFALHYSSSNPSNAGYGFGWSNNLSHYNKTTQMLQLATGGSYKLTWSGITPSIRYYKLDNLHLKGDPSGKYLLIAIHKDGTEEFFNQDGYVVKLENVRGDSLYFHYAGSFDHQRLSSISDDSGKTLLNVEGDDFGLRVHSLQADGSMNTVAVGIQNAHLQNVVFADDKTRVNFQYIATPHFPELISEIDYSSGAKEILQYSTISVPTGGPVAKMYVVKSHDIEPGFNQPIIRTDYRYGLVNGHNYLGYASDVQWRKDVDNLYMRPDNYIYQTEVTHYNGASVIATYNKYHLLLSQKLYNPFNQALVSEVDYQYPNWLDSTIVSLPANYSLATKITTIAYDALPVSHGLASSEYPSSVQHSESYQYDNQGNLLQKTAEDGTITVNQYASADANGFVNQLISQTVTPATVPSTPSVSPTQTRITYQTLPSKDKAMRVDLTLPTSNTLFYQKTPGGWTVTTRTTIHFHDNIALSDYGMPIAEDLANLQSLASGLKKTLTYTHGQTITLWGKSYPVDIKTVQLTSLDGKVKGPISQIYTSLYTGQTLLTVDALGNKTAYRYDALGRVIQVTLNYGKSNAVTKAYGYHSDESGNSLTITAPNGYQTQQTYDGIGRVLATKTEQLDSQGKGVKGAWDTLSTENYTADGKVASKTVYDTNETGQRQSLITTNHYDILGRLVSQSISNGHATVAGIDAILHRSFVYPLFPVKGTIKGTSLCTINGTAYPCGVEHLKVTEKDARGDTVATYLFSLDPNVTNNDGRPLYTGDLKSQLQAHLFNDIAQGKAFDRTWLISWLRQAIVAKAYYTVSRATYNSVHQVLSTTDTDGHITRYAYDRKGRLSTKTLANGAIQTYHYDNLGHIISVGNATSGKDVLLGTRQYDDFGRLTTSTDVLGKSWHYFYNCKNQLTDYTTPNRFHIHYAYDNRGNVITRTVAGQPNATVHMTYDPTTNLLLSTQDKTGTTTYDYAANGRLWQISHTPVAAMQGDTLPAFSEQYRYTLSGKAVTIDSQAGGLSRYHYNQLGQLTSVQHNGKTIANFAYDLAGRLLERTTGPIETVNTYNSLGQLSAYESNVLQGDKAESLVHYQFHYLQDGDLASRVRLSSKGNTTEQYQYDSINNLLAYTCAGPLCPKDIKGDTIHRQNYTFDNWNNIKTVKTAVQTAQGPQSNITTYSYESQDPIRLQQYTNSNPRYGQSALLHYDKDGNITTNEHNQTMTYTPFDQVASVNTTAGTVRYLYNGAHVQVEETAPHQAPLYFQYGAAGLSALVQNNKTTALLYASGHIGEITSDGVMHYAVTDQNGSILSNVLTDAAGKVTLGDQHLYTPYGVQGVPKAPSQNPNPLVSQNLWGFDGQLTDPATGYQFLGQGYHRAYNPVMRRFMNQDSASPFGKGGFNGYIFARNNPIMYGDPSGHMPEWLSWTLIGIGYIAAAALILTGVGAAAGAAEGSALSAGGTTIGLGAAAGISSGLSTGSMIEADKGNKSVAEGLGWAGAAIGVATMVAGTTVALAGALAAVEATEDPLGKFIKVTSFALGTLSTATGVSALGASLAPNNAKTVDILTYVSLGTGILTLISNFAAFNTDKYSQINERLDNKYPIDNFRPFSRYENFIIRVTRLSEKIDWQKTNNKIENQISTSNDWTTEIRYDERKAVDDLVTADDRRREIMDFRRRQLDYKRSKSDIESLDNKSDLSWTFSLRANSIISEKINNIMKRFESPKFQERRFNNLVSVNLED